MHRRSLVASLAALGGLATLPAPALAKLATPFDLKGLVAREQVPALGVIVVTSTQIKHLEVHFLSSDDGEFYFSLLTDWTDSPTESREDDVALLSIARSGVAELNRRYTAQDSLPRFYLLHRKRCWSQAEGKWMGWERKRGKLHELNRLLRGADDTNFVSDDGRPVTIPPDIRYVITLDSDSHCHGLSLSIGLTFFGPLPVCRGNHFRLHHSFGLLACRQKKPLYLQ